jgi:hypothetical protein
MSLNWSSFLVFIDITTALIVFISALNARILKYPLWYKLGLIVSCVGLLAQAFKTIQFLTTGVGLPDNQIALWILKDLGISIICFYHITIATKK